MDSRYEMYMLVDQKWYEPIELAKDHDSRFPLATSAAPDGWLRGEAGVWIELSPIGDGRLPPQGWKIHVSAIPANAESIVTATWEVCRRLRLPWKFVRSRFLVTATCTKYASRSASGKVITVYPRDEIELENALNELDEALSGQSGPYILSDLRWRAGPVHVRYGAFRPMWCEGPSGNRVPALYDDTGRLTPDPRRPAYTVPAWITPPTFIADHLPSEKAKEPRINQFRVLTALHFSNAGGVYLAEDPVGTRVVLKEARPFAGLDGTETDAMTRLRREHAILLKLQDQPFVPRVIDYFSEWEHEYLAIEYVPGQTVTRWLSVEHPLLRHRPTRSALERFLHRAMGVLDKIESCLNALHVAGMTFGDLHPHNIMVRDTGDVVLLDFELGAAVGDAHSKALGAPGFTHPSLTSAVDADWFAMGCCMLAVLVPMTALMTQNPNALAHLLHLAGEYYSLPEVTVERILRHLCRAPGLADAIGAIGRGSATPLRPPSVTALSSGITNVASPHRSDRLYPADIDVNQPGGHMGLAHGASGVLLARRICDEPVPPRHVEWLVEAAGRVAGGCPVGLYDGLAGAALVLRRLGHDEHARRMGQEVMSRLPDHDLTLASGRTGIAHLLFEFGDVDAALAIAESIAARLDQPEALPKPGLFRGWSGPAILFARCAAAVDDDWWRYAACRAIEHDQRWARRAEDGSVNLLHDGKLLCYLAGGSSGLALAVLAVQPENLMPDRARFVSAVARACAVPLVTQGGLLNGRAGLIYFLARVAHKYPEWSSHLDEQLKLLGLHVTRVGEDEIAAGDQLVRLSTDLATGSAGLMLAMYAATHPDKALLPGTGVPPTTEAVLPTVHRTGPSTGIRM